MLYTQVEGSDTASITPWLAFLSQEMEMRDSRGVNPHLSPLVYLIVTPSVAGLAMGITRVKRKH